MAAEKSDPPRPIVVVIPVRVAPMNPPITGTRPSLDQRLNQFPELGIGFFEQRSGAREVAIGHDAIARINQSGFNVHAPTSRGDQFAGKHFAKRRNVIGRSRSEFAHRRDPAQQFFQVLELSPEIAVELREQRGAQQFAGGVVMAFAELAGQSQRGLAIAASGRSRHLQQLVGNPRHGADHDHWPLRQRVRARSPATRSMALASPTEVPPNFMTMQSSAISFRILALARSSWETDLARS